MPICTVCLSVYIRDKLIGKKTFSRIDFVYTGRCYSEIKKFAWKFHIILRDTTYPLHELNLISEMALLIPLNSKLVRIYQL